MMSGDEQEQAALAHLLPFQVKPHLLLYCRLDLSLGMHESLGRHAT